jgi:uncharacterized protein YeaO (DUF488 family)
MEIHVKRVYEKISKNDGVRILADGLWPRGISKSQAGIDLWLKDWAPSGELRKWFHADKEKNYKKFSAKYKKELAAKQAAISRELRKHKTSITLVTAVKDVEKSHIPVLISFLKGITV